jgi:Flp pilus assembly pilin Flp
VTCSRLLSVSEFRIKKKIIEEVMRTLNRSFHAKTRQPSHSEAISADTAGPLSGKALFQKTVQSAQPEVQIKREFERQTPAQKLKSANQFIKAAGREGLNRLAQTPIGQHALAVIYDLASGESRQFMEDVHREQGATAVDYTHSTLLERLGAVTIVGGGLGAHGGALGRSQFGRKSTHLADGTTSGLPLAERRGMISPQIGTKRGLDVEPSTSRPSTSRPSTSRPSTSRPSTSGTMQVGTNAPNKNTVTVYRVDDNAFGPRISGDGEIPVVTSKKGKERPLFINIDQPQRAKEFALVNRNGNATITAVEADASLLEKLRTQSVFDKGEAVRLNPTAPLRVDIHKAPDQFGLRTPEQIQMLREAIDPSTVRIINPNDL